MSKLIVVTGVTRGLGAALRNAFQAAGHTVIGCGRTEQKIQALRAENPDRFSVVDVSDFSDVSRWADDVLANHGTPDLLVNNAALINANAPLWKVSEEEFGRVIDVNIKGIANTIRAFVPSMVDRGSGVIVNFSSYWGRSTSPNVAPYCATKFAVEGLTQALAHDLPNGLAAVAFNPGIIHTDMLKICFGEQAASYPSPAEWAKTAAGQILGLSARDNGKVVTAG